MNSRSVFIKINKINITSIIESKILNDYIEMIICYIIQRALVNNSYSLNIRYNYDSYKIDNAFDIVETISAGYSVFYDIVSLSGILTKNIEQVIDEFYNYTRNKNGILNINSLLVNNDSLLISYEVFDA